MDIDNILPVISDEINSENNFNNEKTLDTILFPMFQLLNEKNIIKGITTTVENGKLYICFNKDGLSPCNQLILEKIAQIYSETIFYSDNIASPNSDRLEFWCPDSDYNNRTHIVERCKNKKLFVLELNLDDLFTILGTTIMIGDILQEQNPIHLKINEGLTVLDSDIIEREKHYNESGCPDLNWLHLHILLNKDNPLNNNPYAPFMNEVNINSPVSCSNLITSIFAGVNEKKYLTFNMEQDELENAIKQYFENKCNCKKEETNKENIIKMLK